MVGRNTAAVPAALLLILPIWVSLINGKYLKEACQYQKPGKKLPCPTCHSSKDCNNYFCLQCQTGGLCPLAFREDHEHRHHPWLQVRLYTKHYSVLSTDLARFISEEGLKHIHTIADKNNGRQRHCSLSSHKVGSSSRARATGRKRCRGCMVSIRGGSRNSTGFLVCSLQCLIKVAFERSEWDLLTMKEGAMEPMGPPRTFNEKLSRGPRILETLTATPIGEAPPSPQATGDSPMLEIHVDLPEESILDSPALPFDDYLVLDTPAEASFGEAPPLPPATEIEDFPMFENPAAPPEPPEPETFALPPELEDLDDICREMLDVFS